MRSPSVYLDANILIALYPSQAKAGSLTPEQRAGLMKVLNDINDGNCIAVASALIYSQTLTVSAEHIEMLYDGRSGLIVALDEQLAMRSRELCRRCYKDHKKTLSPEDSIHLVTASVMKCGRFITMDRRRKDNQLSPIQDRAYLEKLLSGMKIIEPHEVEGDQKPLPFEPLEDKT